MKTNDRFQLTVKKRVLVHLLDHHQSEEVKVPITITQEGIAEGSEIYLTHASRAVKELEKSGLLNKKLRYVEGAKRRRMAYFLTPEGVSKAREIKTRLEKKEISVRGLDGKTKKVKLSGINDFVEKEIGLRYPVLKIVNSISNDTLDCKSLLKEEKEYADFMNGIIKLRYCFDKGKTTEEIIKACAAVGEIYVSTGNRGRAIEFFNKSLDTFTQLGVEKCMGRIRQLRRIYPSTNRGLQNNDFHVLRTLNEIV